MIMIKKLLFNKSLWAGGIGLLALLMVAFQVAPVEKTNPPVTNEPQWDSPQTQALVEKSCFDCHSNETVWPWYADFGPTRILVRNHVEEGRGELNFSEYNGHVNINEIIEVIDEGEMPPWDYVLMHPDAKLSDNEKAQLITGLKATFSSSTGG